MGLKNTDFDKQRNAEYWIWVHLLKCSFDECVLHLIISIFCNFIPVIYVSLLGELSL